MRGPAAERRGGRVGQPQPFAFAGRAGCGRAAPSSHSARAIGRQASRAFSLNWPWASRLYGWRHAHARAPRVLVEQAEVLGRARRCGRGVAASSGPQTGDWAAARKRLAKRLAATSRGAQAVPLAHQSVHSPCVLGRGGPGGLLQVLASPGRRWPAAAAARRPSRFQAATKSASGGNGGSLS